MTRLVLHSPLGPIAAAHRLKAAVGETLNIGDPKCVTGNGTEANMVLWVHRPNFRNDFQTRFIATMEAEGGGARIDGRMGMPRSVRVFMTLWIAFVAAFALLGVVLIAVRVPWPVGAMFLGIPCLMLAIAAGLLWLGRRAGREDADAILRFLAETIDARPR